MGKKTEDKIDIDKLDFNELVECAKGVFEDRERCPNLSCVECRSEQRNYYGEFQSCGMVRDSIALKVMEAVLERIEQLGQNKEKGSCQSCKHIRETCGCLFCDFWHNYTTQDEYCYGFADKQEPVDKS